MLNPRSWWLNTRALGSPPIISVSVSPHLFQLTINSLPENLDVQYMACQYRAFTKVENIYSLLKETISQDHGPNKFSDHRVMCKSLEKLNFDRNYVFQKINILYSIYCLNSLNGQYLKLRRNTKTALVW